MLRKRETPAFDQVDTLIGADTVLQGKITANGTIRIDGVLEGELLTKGDVVIGDSGKVKANLQARNILVAGQINGDINASGRVEVAATGRIFGELKVKSLVIADGAVFQGSCQMKGAVKDSEPKGELRLGQA